MLLVACSSDPSVNDEPEQQGTALRMPRPVLSQAEQDASSGVGGTLSLIVGRLRFFAGRRCSRLRRRHARPLLSAYEVGAIFSPRQQLDILQRGLADVRQCLFG